MVTNNCILRDKTILKKKVAMNEFVLIINDSEVFGKSTQTSFFDKKEATTETSGATKPKMFRVKFFVPWTCFFGLLFCSMADQDNGEYDADISATDNAGDDADGGKVR